MKAKNDRRRRPKASASNRGYAKVEPRPDGRYDLVMIVQVAETFLAAKKKLEKKKGHAITDADTLDHILAEAISILELGHTLDGPQRL